MGNHLNKSNCIASESDIQEANSLLHPALSSIDVWIDVPININQKTLIILSPIFLMKSDQLSQSQKLPTAIHKSVMFTVPIVTPTIMRKEVDESTKEESLQNSCLQEMQAQKNLRFRNSKYVNIHNVESMTNTNSILSENFQQQNFDIPISFISWDSLMIGKAGRFKCKTFAFGHEYEQEGQYFAEETAKIYGSDYITVFRLTNDGSFRKRAITDVSTRPKESPRRISVVQCKEIPLLNVKEAQSF
mmetsp:Transcript_1932/g.2486  ORF Transcript_1932/g.2486 Transcript_1932/m.2486 type:complete len:246 (-) Transcript_1932:208-945(-)